MTDPAYASALDFDQRTIYYPQVRPGYAAWANLFQFGNGDLGIAFNELRRGKNADFAPPTLEFTEAVGMPYGMLNVAEPMADPNMISEYVHLRSTDKGETWVETGRCPVRTRHYWCAGFPDGRMVRIYTAEDYANPYGDGFRTLVEESFDGGNTWARIADFLPDCYINMFKFKKLSDGRLVAAGSIRQSWGPGGKKITRHLQIPDQCFAMEAMFIVSEDGGHTWDGPHYVFPGIVAWEFDFVELPGGDLLFINSTVQSGPPVRQISRNTDTGYVNDPLMHIRRGRPEDDNICSGFVPEAIAIRPDGLIIGAKRHCPYACSKDLGANWYEIDGAPPSVYQPMCDILPDGRLLTVWHYDGDPTFGRFDMYIGTHAFRVEADNVPRPTRLELRRDLTEDRSRYRNAFNAELTAEGKPLPGREVGLRVQSVWRPSDGLHDPRDVSESPDVRVAVTDEAGVARFELAEKDAAPDIHAGYWVMPRFSPKPGDPAAPCDGPKYMAYPIVAVRNQLQPYAAFTANGTIFISPETSRRFPDLAEMIGKFDGRDPDAALDQWIAAAGGEARAREILSLLVDSRLLHLGDDGLYRWYRAVHCGEEVIKEVRVNTDLVDHCV